MMIEPAENGRWQQSLTPFTGSHAGGLAGHSKLASCASATAGARSAASATPTILVSGTAILMRTLRSLHACGAAGVLGALSTGRVVLAAGLVRYELGEPARLSVREHETRRLHEDVQVVVL